LAAVDLILNSNEFLISRLPKMGCVSKGSKGAQFPRQSERICGHWKYLLLASYAFFWQHLEF
jgi:hypothetical protein